MAKGNMLLGTLRGSIGDVTFTRTAGKQVSKAKATSVRNPRTSKQIYQRMFFATIAKAQSAMKSIVDHSFEQVQHGSKSLQYFSKRNIALLRNNCNFNPDTQQWEGPGMSFVTPNWQSFTFNKYRMSEGSLPILNDMAPYNPDLDPNDWDSYDKKLLMPFYINFSKADWFAGDDVTGITEAWNNIMSQYGVKKGDYLTMVLITAKKTDMAGAGVIYPNNFHYFRFKVQKINLKYQEVELPFLYPVLTNVDGDNVFINDEIDVTITRPLDMAIYRGLFADSTIEGENYQIPYISLVEVTGYNASWAILDGQKGGVNKKFNLPFVENEDVILAGTWIHSRPVGSKLLVSTADMVLYDNTGDIYDYNLGLNDAYDEWNAKTKQVGDNSLILQGGDANTGA